ncbi:MAK10-like protein [Tanacetum coccineum]
MANATTARKVSEAGFYRPYIFAMVRKLGHAGDAWRELETYSQEMKPPLKSHTPSTTVSQWVEAQAFPTNDARNVVNFLKRLFAQFGIPKALISDRVSKDMKNGAIKMYDEEGSEFIVNKQRVKPYQKNVLDINRDDDITLEDQGEVTRTIAQLVTGKLRDLNAEESWALLADLALYNNESWNDPRDFAKPVKAISLPQDVLSTSDSLLI